MSYQKLLQQMIGVTLVALLSAACGTPAATSTPVPPTATAVPPTPTPVPPTASPTSVPTATYTSLPTAIVEATKTPEMATGVVWPTTTEQGNQIIQKILAALSDSGMQVVDTVSFTDASDPNSLLGRPHQYIAKAVWRDPNIAAQGEPSVDNGGTMEIFLNQADLQARYDYVDAITSSSPLFAEYHYQNAPAFLRLSKAYLPSQAQKIADVFLALVFNK